MNQVGVVAKFRIKKEYLIDVYNELIILHKLTHDLDEGCIQYDLHQDLEDEQTFIFIEIWQNMDCLKQHEQKEHFLTCIKNIEDKLEHIDIHKTAHKL
jgi:quinol monooxygenase YgiN